MVPEPDFLKWAIWFETAARGLDETFVTDTRTGERIRIATSFVGLSGGEGRPPLLWETLVFGGRMDGEGKRSATVEEARQAHREFADRVRGKHAR